jgi:hypothetical protein
MAPRPSDAGARPGWREEMLALLRRGRPDFTGGEPVCLAEVLQGLVEPPTSSSGSLY